MTMHIESNIQKMADTPDNKSSGGLVIMPKISALEQFMSRLNEQPDASEIKVNDKANNSKYIPISFLMNKLDEIFLGLWQFTLIREQVIANEIIGVGVLKVFHPIANVWIERTGSASVMIQQMSKDRGGSGRISNIDDKIKNTLVKDFPHLESECIKSAAKKLGKIFGRDLNREFTDIYSPIYSEMNDGQENFTHAVNELQTACSEDDFTGIWNKYENLQKNTEFHKNFMYYKRKNIKTNGTKTKTGTAKK